MRQSVRPTSYPNIQSGIVCAKKPFTLIRDQLCQLLIAKVHHIRVEGAAENPGLGMRRPAPFENTIIEEHAPRAKALPARKQTTEAFQASRFRRVETCRCNQRQHFNA